MSIFKVRQKVFLVVCCYFLLPKAELNRLKEANQSTLEAQKLLLTELNRINRLQKSVKEVVDREKITISMTAFCVLNILLN